MCHPWTGQTHHVSKSQLHNGRAHMILGNISDKSRSLSTFSRHYEPRFPEANPRAGMPARWFTLLRKVPEATPDVQSVQNHDVMDTQ
jgi:hypothetical protein